MHPDRKPDGGDRPGLLVFDDPAAAAAHVGQLVAETVAEIPATVLGLATGATMRPVYVWLLAAHRGGRLSFSRATSFNLDEYAGLGPAHPASFAATMRRMLFDGADFAPGRTHLPDGTAAGLEAEAARYEAAIRAAGEIGLQLLGIGRNGHIGFNEPGSRLDSTTRVVALTEDTRAANRAGFPSGEEVPNQAITMGIGTIMRARRIVLLATGLAKAEAVARAWAGAPGSDCPASALQGHPATLFVCDREAASGIAAPGERSDGR